MATIGDSLAPFAIDRIDPQAMQIWAGLLHDPNPIHLDRAAVVAAGLGDRRINQGPANLAYIINMLRRALPDRRLGSIDVRYMANVLEDDAVVAGGIVTAIDDDAIVCDVWLDVADRGRALSGVATMIKTTEIKQSTEES
jgi:3-hydroxybutyryl-CoA dehydratase